jgi:signal transduction histidine kinase
MSPEGREPQARKKGNRAAPEAERGDAEAQPSPISELAAQLASAPSPAAAARSLATAALAAVRSQSASVVIFDDGADRRFDAPESHKPEPRPAWAPLLDAARAGRPRWSEGPARAAAIPLLAGELPLGALMVELDDRTPITEADRDLLGALAGLGAQALAAAARDEQSRARVALLAEAVALTSSDLDGLELLNRLASLVVPRLADFCAIDVLRSGRAVRVAAVHREPSRTWMVRELGDGEFDAFPRTPTALVALADAPLLYPELPEPALAAMFDTERDTTLLRALAPTSALAVPLRARGQVQGVLIMGLSSQTRRLGPDDLRMAEELARSAALGLDRWHLREEAGREHSGRRRAEADRERLLFELRDAVQVRDSFLSIASHELKTPLTALQLAVQSAERSVALLGPTQRSAQAAYRLAIAERQVRRLSALVDRLLDVSRMDVGLVALEPQAVDLRHVVQDVLDRVEPEARRAGCELQPRLGTPVEGRWDPARLDEVISILMSNALKYGAGKPVRVELSVEEGRARLTVADRGIGVSRADQKRIFGRFERAVSAMHYPGLGLGLWIARRIVDACGGTIRVESELGCGAAFVVELPKESSELRAQG